MMVTYNANMQIGTIVNSHYIIEAQYVAIKHVYTWMQPAILIILQWGNKGGEGKEEVG